MTEDIESAEKPIAQRQFYLLRDIESGTIIALHAKYFTELVGGEGALDRRIYPCLRLEKESLALVKYPMFKPKVFVGVKKKKIFQRLKSDIIYAADKNSYIQAASLKLFDNLSDDGFYFSREEGIDIASEELIDEYYERVNPQRGRTISK